MPYKNIVINPPKYSDQIPVQQSQIYKGFSTVDETRVNTKIYDFELIKQDLLNQFNTRKGERVMNPNFGTLIWDSIFEPFTDQVKQEIGDDIKRITTSDPRITPIQINIVEQDYGMLLELTLLYNGTDQTEKISLSFDKELGIINGVI